MTQIDAFGLSPQVLERINGIFQRADGIERVLLYGSRAKGNFKRGSDIDLTVVGPSLSSTDLFRLEAELDELALPYKIDLSLFHQIQDPELLKHIARVGKILYEAAGSRKPGS